MLPLDCLMLDAKEALLDDQHRKFIQCYREGRWEEASARLQASIDCTTALLEHSIQVLRGFEQAGSDSPHHAGGGHLDADIDGAGS